MGWSEAEVRCKKHPKHRQSPGVCSFCLRERLSQLPSVSSSRNTITTTASSCSSSLSSSPCSSGSSSCSSPVRYRFSSEAKGPVAFLKSGNGGFLRSRSVAFVVRNRVGDGSDGRKKRGFWSKLIRSTSKRTKKVLMHSRTVRERSSNRVY